MLYALLSIKYEFKEFIVSKRSFNELKHMLRNTFSSMGGSEGFRGSSLCYITGGGTGELILASYLCLSGVLL